MLVIPVSGNFKKAFPYVTLCLILLNCFIFFGFQQNEEEAEREAFSFYAESGLLDIEAQLYEEYLERNNKDAEEEVVIQEMMQDEQFQLGLLERSMMKPDDPRHADWLSLREQFEQKLNKIFSHRFGYSPARKNYAATVTCMFLHGSIMHLLGNMVFLWFVGSLLEIGIRRWPLYLAGYLLTGVLASLAFGAVYPTSPGPLVGASGAIAGLMGTYGLLYGRSNIRVFYSLGFYFDYATVPGWALFPFWLGKELLQLFTDSGSHIAYMAHIGGLLSGALLGLAFLSRPKNANELLETEKASPVPALLEQGLHYLAELKLPEAREKMVELLQHEPDHLPALTHLFSIDKCAPESEQFHQTAAKLLQRLAALQDYQALEDRFAEYQRLSGSPRLQPALLLALAKAKISSGSTTEAARFLSVLLKKQPQYAGLPGCLFKLGQTFQEQGKTEQAKKCFGLIYKQYSGTSISQKAGDQLRQLEALNSSA